MSLIGPSNNITEVDAYSFALLKDSVNGEGILFTNAGKIATDNQSFVLYSEYDKLLLAYRNALKTIHMASDRVVLKNKNFKLSDKKFFGPFSAEFEQRIEICKRGLDTCDQIMLADKRI